jgi:hypothetical protein
LAIEFHDYSIRKKLNHASILSEPYKILFLYCCLVFLQANFYQGLLNKNFNCAT